MNTIRLVLDVISKNNEDEAKASGKEGNDEEGESCTSSTGRRAMSRMPRAGLDIAVDIV